MSTLNAIVEDLRSLPPPKLEEAAALIRRLSAVSRSERNAALERSACILSDKDGAELEKIVQEHCEKVDPRDW